MTSATYRFGEFELDSSRYELRRRGRTLKLERIPMELLTLLVERDGQLVSRQEIVERLWGKDVFVDTEHGINTAIRKIRTALREDVEHPRFIQTLSGKGYRFVPQTLNTNSNATPPAAEKISPPTEAWNPPNTKVIPTKTDDRLRSRLVGAAIGFSLLAGVLLVLDVSGLRARLFTKKGISPIHSIAVLPLANLSGDPTQEYFADGMTDELITALARNRSLRVVSRTSAMQYKGVNKPLPDIAKALGVDGILEGSVNRSGNHVHVTLQLIYAPGDTHVWAESYDRDLNGALALPAELSQIIASEAKVGSTPARPQRSISPEAHDAYLRGRYAWFADRGDYKESKEYLEKAIQLQPDYAAAWAFLSASYAASAVSGGSPPQESFAEAWKDARKAVEFDESVAEGHNSLAACYLFNGWDWQRAESESLRAIELDPNFSEGHHVHAYELLAMNRDDEALQEEKRADEIDPFARPWALGLAYIRLHRYKMALTEIRARMQTQMQDPGYQDLLAEAYRFNGMEKDSAQSTEQMFLALDDKQSALAVRHAFEQGGDHALNEWLLNHDLDRAGKNYISPFDLASDYARLERKEQTLRSLDVAVRERSPWLIFLQKEPVFDFLHSDERYRSLVRKIGLPPEY